MEGIASANPDKNVKSRYRILEIPEDFYFLKPKNALSHNSLRHLRRYDETWKRLKATSGKIADKICEEIYS